MKLTNIELPTQLLRQKYTDIHLLEQAIASSHDLLHTKALMMINHLVSLNVDLTTLIVTALYPRFQSNHIDDEQVITTYGAPLLALLKGTQHMEAMTRASQRDTQNKAEQVRKMLVAMVNDARIILIKLAERLATLEMLRSASENEQQAAAHDVMAIFAPLANRLGIGQLKWQLEDWSFRYLNNAEYKRISKSLNMKRDVRDAFINTMMARLTDMVNNTHITNASITGRSKHIYSIYKKMQRKHIDIDELYDVSAVRIIVPNLPDCYALLGIVHATWEHIPKEFDDYIANPKPNGYRSIHTAVLGPDNIIVEIQIRTQAMHEEAELGVAAHWAYKEGKQATANEKASWLKHVLEWQEEVDEQPVENVEIYVFTPNGDIINLPKGATPLDFAYHIHTAVGHRCRGAKVNGKLVQLTQPLALGDRVEIQTAKEEKPSRDWLNRNLHYLTTHRARDKVNAWFRKAHYQENLAHGQALWEKATRQKTFTKTMLDKTLTHFNLKRFDDLLVAIGANDLNVRTVLNTLQSPSDASPPTEDVVIKKTLPRKPQKTGVSVEGSFDVLTHIAKCCNPIPGDAILGYVSSGRGVIVHHKECNNLKHLQREHPERVLETQWSENPNHAFVIDLVVIVNERNGLLRDITSLIMQEKLTVVTLQTHRNDSQTTIYLAIELPNLTAYKNLLQLLQKIPDVVSVQRKGM